MNTLTRIGRIVPLSEFPRQVSGHFDRRDLDALLADADPPERLTQEHCRADGHCFCRPDGRCCDCRMAQGGAW